MILTGKCKKDFNTFISYRLEYISSDCLLDKTLLNSLIIEWFDSVGIIINILNQDLQRWFYYEIKTIEKIKGFELVRTRQEATEQAIFKANEIYNING